ncbi:MAG: hypothetical protein KIS92_26125 [Planctomycetota bacterium]|nr:hypothetical protein [Planctomycetota bacterium]
MRNVLAAIFLVLPVAGWCAFLWLAPAEIPAPPPDQVVQWEKERQPPPLPPPEPPAPSLPMGWEWTGHEEFLGSKMERKDGFGYIVAVRNYMKAEEAWDNRKHATMLIPGARSSPNDLSGGWKEIHIPSVDPPTAGGSRRLTGVPLAAALLNDSYLPRPDGPEGRATVQVLESGSGAVVYSAHVDLGAKAWGPAERRDWLFWWRDPDGINSGEYTLRLTGASGAVLVERTFRIL